MMFLLYLLAMFRTLYKDLEWLKREVDRRNQNLTEDMKYCYILQAEFKTATVFRYEDCNPAISKFVITLNCAGERIDSNENGISLEDLKNRRVIWKTNDFACQLD